MPLPRADHVLPFHRAMWLAATPPAVVKYPPAYMSPLPAMARAPTELFMPLPLPTPTADHALPFQRAMLLATTPPAVMKDPSMYTSPLWAMARAVTRVYWSPPKPLPRADHV